MQLVDESVHSLFTHKGSASEIQAAAKSLKSN
jgi:hypothetical protein